VLYVDGSQGEGGGQALRSCLALSIVTGQAVEIDHIRLGRPKPGLQAQHLQAVQAAAQISSAEVDGAEPGATHLIFRPETTRAGRYRFDIGTAGSTSLVLQTVFLPLSLASGSSILTLSGGTHVPFSPTFHFLDMHWLPFINQAGFRVRLTLEQAGFYPAGGGRIQASFRQASEIIGLDLADRGELKRIQGISAVANLDRDIAKRMKHQALRRLTQITREVKIKEIELSSPVKGAYILLLAEFEKGRCCGSALGAPGKRAEKVADEAVDQMEAFLAGAGAIDPYLADQLLLPLSFASGPSKLSTTRVTGHLLTNAAIIQQFTTARIEIRGAEGGPGLVVITPTQPPMM
jgi:RNA 3'-phosphate cyclase